MSTSKHIDKICIAAVAVVLALTILFMCSGSLGLSVLTKAVKYEKTIFDTSYVHQIDIVMNDWDSFLESCENEEYAACTVVVDGAKHANTAIRAKGNTSLSSVKASGSQRYSFKLEFDHFDGAGSLDGLDKLCLNNLIQDNTMMKDYLVYLMMNEFGADSPLCSFVYLTVNGEDWGLYLAVEGVEDSFLTRNYGADFGELYKPDSLSFGGGRGNGRNFNMDDLDLDGSKSDEDSETGETREQQATTQPQESRSDSDTGNGSIPFGGQMPGGGDMPEPPDFGGGFPGGMPNGEELPEGFDFSQMPNGASPPEGFDFSQMPDGAASPEGFDFDAQSAEPPTSDAQAEENASPAANASEKNDSDKNDSDKNSSDKDSGKRLGFGGMGSDDVKLKYIDDDPDSYSNIFDSAKTKVTKADKVRLIASLKKLSAYEDLENVLDTDEVLRYFVVHNFVCNGDSYTGAMIHNYYLHESDGKLGMIPWDYNLAFGTFQGGNASDSVNTSIDNPLSGGSMDDRPMLGWIFSDESYTAQYHALFSEFLEKWFANGELETLIADTAEMIRPYVEKDPTKFCTTEDFTKGVETLSKFVSLRAEAVSRQLSGDDTAVETGALDLSLMGTMGGGMGKGFSGRFDVTSMVTLTDKDGKETTLSDLVGKDDSIESVTLSDGTTVKLSETDMKELMQLDLSTIVSATDKDGNKIDLSEYTVSIRRSSDRDGSSKRGGAPTAPNQSENGDKTRPDSAAETQTSGTPEAQDESAQRSSRSDVPTAPNQGESAPRSSGTRPPMPNGGSFPSGGGTGKSSEASFWIWIGVSVLVLAAGLMIAIKKKD